MPSSGRPHALHALGSLDAREARRLRAVRTLFTLSLITWTALAVWWATYFYRTVGETRAAALSAHLSQMELVAHLAAESAVPAARVEGTPYVLAAPGEVGPEWPSVPFVDGRVLTPGPAERARLDHIASRRYLMLAGEGSLLVLLLFVLNVALYRSLMSEWRLNRQRETFVHSVTHELKSPVAGLRALLETLRTDPATGPDTAQFLEMGLVELRRLDRLVANILLTASLDARAWAPTVAELDLAAALRAARDRWSLRFTERGGTLTVDVPATLPVRFDPDALETILENLVDNALKYAQGAPKLELRATVAGGVVRVAAKDGGIGFAPADGPRLFEKFFRAGGGEARVAKGSGLGLFIARGLARACGGDLRATSDGAGTGATFELDLPAAA